MTKENQDNHSAWIIHIKDIVKEGNDDSQNNEELSSRCNMLHFLPALEHEEDDIKIVQESKSSLFNKFVNLFK